MASTGDVVMAAHELFARSGGPVGDGGAGRPPIYKVIGIVLAVASGLFIGISFVLKKMGLLKANVKYNEEAGEGYGYLKNVWWWSGMILMIIGEICNFVAYAFVDAILVTPLGALSVVVTTILSAIFLKERLSFVGKVGCFNCIIGSIVIVLNAPSQSSAATIEDMKRFVIAPGFLSYAGVVIVGCTILAFWAGPRYGKKSMLVYLTICSLIGGLSVVATQGLGAAVITQISGTPQFNQWFLYVLLVFVIATLLVEIVYLNKALNIFNAALVTPTYYVIFTSATIVSSAILFQGFKGTAASISTVVLGFLQICAGVVLLQLSKSAKDVPDTAVFKGDLDQVRTVAEQEEPESEPRADTIRGSAALLRAISVSRQKRQVEEVKKLQEEHMHPIGENEQVEFDGIRRRRTTIVQPGSSPRPSVPRNKTAHPPLGMSRFPDYDEATDNQDDDHHPGFSPNTRNRSYSTWIGRIRSLSSRSPGPAPHTATFPLGGLEHPGSEESLKRDPDPYLHPSSATLPLRNQENQPPGSHHAVGTSYQSPPSPSAIQWNLPSETHSDHKSRSSPHLVPPPPPPHSAKRQFSFQSVFSRSKSHDSTSGDHPSPRDTLGFRSGRRSHQGKTEEESLGLVHGDSRTALTRAGGPLPQGDGTASDSDSSLTDDLPAYKSDPEDVADTPKISSVTGGYDARRRRTETADTWYADDPDEALRSKETGGRGPSRRDGYF